MSPQAPAADVVDHRRLGRELDLFDTHPLIGAGLPVWLPYGAAVRDAVERYVREVEARAGYQRVYSPPLGKRELYQISGHLSHYRDEMFPPMPDGGDELVLRPSLCPHHALIFASRGRSWRDLPLRLAELGGQYRDERSGVLGGLTRVRAITLDDGHIFCPLDRIGDEVARELSMIDAAYRVLGLHVHRYRLSLRGEGTKYVADPGMWDRAEAMLRDALDALRLPYDPEPGEAAFYGPKIDVQVVDPAGREQTASTVQLDFHQPERFELRYVGADSARHQPAMVHRSVVGALERVVGHLIEVHAGAFPVWLAPVQVAVLPIGVQQAGAAADLAARLAAAGLRAEVAAEGSLGARIRREQQRKVPYLAVIGEREAANGDVALRLRGGHQLPPMPLADAVHLIADIDRTRSLSLLPA